MLSRCLTVRYRQGTSELIGHLPKGYMYVHMTDLPSFWTARDPFVVLPRRFVSASFVVVHVTPGNPKEICTLSAGQRCIVRDIEDDSVLLSCGTHWYRAQLDDVIAYTRAKSPVNRPKAMAASCGP